MRHHPAHHNGLGAFSEGGLQRRSWADFNLLVTCNIWRENDDTFRNPFRS